MSGEDNYEWYFCTNNGKDKKYVLGPFMSFCNKYLYACSTPKNRIKRDIPTRNVLTEQAK